MDVGALHFLRPWWLLAVPFLLGWLYWSRRVDKQHQQMDHWGDPSLLQYLWLRKPRAAQSSAWYWQIMIWLSLVVLALSGPAWQKLPTPNISLLGSTVLVVDLSPSALVTDQAPSRLARTKFKLRDWVNQLENEQVALVVFGANAYTASPLTSDKNTLLRLIDALHPKLLPLAGDQMTPALDLSRQLLNQANRHGHVVVFTAGSSDMSTAMVATRQLTRDGHRLSVMGLGTELGGPIPNQTGRFSQQLSKRQTAALKALANVGQGQYLAIQPDNQDVRLFKGITQQLTESGKTQWLESQASDYWVDMGIWLMIPIVLWASYGLARIGLQLAWTGLWLLPLLGMLSLPKPLIAADDDQRFLAPSDNVLPWYHHIRHSMQSWFQTDNERGLQAFIHKDYTQAAKTFDDPVWQAFSLYKAGDLAQAMIRWQDWLTQQDPSNASDYLDVAYNLATAHAYHQHWSQALEGYDLILSLDAHHLHATRNKRLIEEHLKAFPPHQHASPNLSFDGQTSQETQAPLESQNGLGEAATDPLTSTRSNDGDQPNADANQKPASSLADSNQTEDALAQAVERDKVVSSGDESASENLIAHPEPSAEKMDGHSAVGSAMDGAVDLPASTMNAEQQQALTQWLRQIPDDPALLLKRQFLLQHYQQQAQESPLLGD